jgi:hypothetical protein
MSFDIPYQMRQLASLLLFLTEKGKQHFYKLLAFWRLVRPFTHFTKNAKYNNNL